MTDMRRTLLWSIFVVSLVMLWDGWSKHTGQPSFFGAHPTAPAAAGSANAAGGTGIPAPVTTSGVPSPAAAGATTGATAGAAPAPVAAAGTAPAAAPSETVTITTDVVKATLDTRGGSVVRMELLQVGDLVDPKQPTVLFDNSVQRTYQAESGLINASGGGELPTHRTPMKLVEGPRTL